MVLVPLSVSGKTVLTVPVSGSGSVPEPPCKIGIIERGVPQTYVRARASSVTLCLVHVLSSKFPKLARGGFPWFSSLFAKAKGCNPLQLALQFFRPCFPNFSSRSDVNGLGQTYVFFWKNKKQTSLLRASEQGHPWTNHLLQDFCSQGLVPFFFCISMASKM